MRTLTLLAVALVTFASTRAASAQEPDTSGYAWAAACKDCHAEIYDAWSKTKHARTINRLSGDERKAGSACIGCHVSGPREPVVVSGELVNANVQCESCHGAGKAHVEGAKAGNAAPAGLVKKPQSAVCEACHNDKSPHYRGFYYNALAPFVHKH